jgi:hypothetical protein
MENTLMTITIISFLLCWLVIVILYTPSCFNLKTMIDSINYDGKLTKTKAPLSMYFKTINTLECWTISLPKDEKYLKYERVRRTINVLTPQITGHNLKNKLGLIKFGNHDKRTTKIYT